MNSRQRLILLPVLGVLSVALYCLSQLTVGNRDTYGCQSNLKQIGLGLSQYQRDYDERNVMAVNWKTATWPYTKNEKLFDCPAGHLNYALNRFTSGVSHAQIEDYRGTPTVFDSITKSANAADFGDSYPRNHGHSLWRRESGTNVLFFDGHVKLMQQKPAFLAIKPVPTPLPPIVIREIPVKRDSKGRMIMKIQGTAPR